MGVLSTLKNLFNKNGNRDQQTNSKESLSAQQSVKDNSIHTESLNSRKGSVKNSSKTESVTKSSVTSPTTSTRQQTSSAGYSFQYKDGRRYHADESVAYILPNDDDEADRVHEQHWILRYVLQGNFFSPVTEQLEKGIKVLDSGCGPATWAFEMAEAYPLSKFYGIDASCVFPEDIKPSNVEFVIGNIAKELPYDENFFDYIHQRLLILGLTSDDWTNTLNNLYKVLKPGGYIELGEPDLQGVKDAGPGMYALQTTLSEMSKARGLPPNIAAELKDRMAKAGFVDITVKVSDLPLNHSGKAGQLLWGDYKQGYSNLHPIMSKVNPAWESAADYAALIDQCGEEAKNSKTCVKWYSIRARKAEN